AGAAISAGGAFTWTPAEAQGPGDYTITVRVTDNGSPPLSDTKAFHVHVDEVNVAPVLAAIADQVITETHALTLTAAASDPDVPGQTLAFSLDAGAPAGAAIDAATGAFTWTPTEAQGPGEYDIAVTVSDGTASDTKSFHVTVNEVNQAPALSGVPASADID